MRAPPATQHAAVKYWRLRSAGFFTFCPLNGRDEVVFIELRHVVVIVCWFFKLKHCLLH